MTPHEHPRIKYDNKIIPNRLCGSHRDHGLTTIDIDHKKGIAIYRCTSNGCGWTATMNIKATNKK